MRRISAIGEPSSACFSTKTICPCVNLDVVVRLSCSRPAAPEWEIPAENDLLLRGQGALTVYVLCRPER